MRYFIESVPSSKNITFDSMLQLYDVFYEKYRRPNVIRCSPKAYNDLCNFIYDSQAINGFASDFLETLKLGLNHGEYQRIIGLDILIDSELYPGEWRAEYIAPIE